ncbi:MAG: TrkA family potassium uptake protein [Erysipelotrichaceae bacterium]|nr:TrkA family potassium uptake protein [Erysipelotrichaceae bacterium]
MSRKSYAVLGLGVFGSTIATTLASFDYDVIAVDLDNSCVERVLDDVTSAVVADITDIDQLKAIGIGDVDCAIVATGTHLEDSIMAIMNLKELNVPYIVAKAKNKKYMQILERVGADRVIRPEKEMGVRVAKQLVSPNIVDLIDIDNKYSVIEILAPNNWVNNTLAKLNLRNRFGVNVLGVRKSATAPLSISPSADYLIEADDRLLVIASKEKFDTLGIN